MQAEGKRVRDEAWKAKYREPIGPETSLYDSRWHYLVRTVIVPPHLAGANTARAVGVIPRCPEVEAAWVELWFRNPERIHEMTSKSHEVASGKPRISKTFSNALVALPPSAEQHRIVAEVERRLSLIGDLEDAVSANLKRADHLRQSILKRAFEGKLVPQDPADEPASLLLETDQGVRRLPCPCSIRTDRLPG